MYIKLLKDQTWRIGAFKKDTVLEIGVTVPEKTGKDMLEHGYAEEIGDIPDPSVILKTETVIEEPVQEEAKNNETQVAEIEKIKSLSKKELIIYANDHGIELDDTFMSKAAILTRVLKNI